MIGALTHWGRATLICVSKLTIVGSNNDLPPGRYQAIIWINAGILLIRPLEITFSEIIIDIYTFSFKKMHLKTSSRSLWWPFCLGLDMLMTTRAGARRAASSGVTGNKWPRWHCSNPSWSFTISNGSKCVFSHTIPMAQCKTAVTPVH